MTKKPRVVRQITIGKARQEVRQQESQQRKPRA